MKKIYTILLLLVFTLTTQAQVTYHFPHSGAQWGQFNGICCFPNLSGNTTFITAMGDSILNGKTYINLYFAPDSSRINAYPGRLIREDSTGRVYYFNPYTNSDTLLYNFNLKAGDTAKIYSTTYSEYNPVVDSVRYYHVFNENRKCIFFNQRSQGGPSGYLVQPLQWIEGIGSTDGLLIPNGAQFLVDGDEWLTCFKQNDSLKYGNVCDQVFGGTGIKDDKESSSFKIYPNPGNGLFKIIAGNKINGNYLFIYNALGQLIIKQPVEPNSLVTTVNLLAKAKGVYFLFTNNLNGDINNAGTLIKE